MVDNSLNYILYVRYKGNVCVLAHFNHFSPLNAITRAFKLTYNVKYFNQLIDNRGLLIE
jgi:hypothetical protein